MPSRRSFLRRSAATSLGLAGTVHTLAQLRLTGAALAADPPGDAGYKALVCLYQGGGIDSNNLLVPRSGTARNHYNAARGVLTLETEDLHPITPASNTAGASYAPSFGIHPEGKHIADLFDAGHLAFVCNTGTLAFPVVDRDTYQSGTVPLPPQLFSHSDQSKQWQATTADGQFNAGWGGRAADLLHAAYNSPTASKISTSVSIAGINDFQVGLDPRTAQYALTSNGAISLAGYGTNYSNALRDPSHPGSYLNNDNGDRLRAFQTVMDLTHDNLLEETYNRTVRNARATEGVVGAALEAARGSGVNFDTTFAPAVDYLGNRTRLGNQLRMVAQLIAGRGTLGNNRQIFFVRIGGHDTHIAQGTTNNAAGHPRLVLELAGALRAFHDTMTALGVADQVTTFTATDFNRTLTPNKSDATAGSDHAWGGHPIVMGGAVNGGELYGHFPSLRLGTDMDAQGSRGRWVPTTSVDQYAAVLSRWMGLSDEHLATIFPNLSRFDDPFTTSSANLAFL